MLNTYVVNTWTEYIINYLLQIHMTLEFWLVFHSIPRNWFWFAFTTRLENDYLYTRRSPDMYSGPPQADSSILPLLVIDSRRFLVLWRISQNLNTAVQSQFLNILPKCNFELTAYAIFEKNPYFSWTNIIGHRILQELWLLKCCWGDVVIRLSKV